MANNNRTGIRNALRHNNEIEEQPHMPHMHLILTSCTPKWISKAMMVLLVLSILILILYFFQPHQSDINVLLINLNNPPIFKTDERYLSVALDASIIARNFAGFNMRNPKLQSMMKLLGNSYLRIGGIMADRLNFAPDTPMYYSDYFENDGGTCAYDADYCRIKERNGHKNFTLNATAWKELNWLAKRSNMIILFDLNALHRTAAGAWDSKNAEQLIDFSEAQGFDVIWELGNEPNAYKHIFNYEISGYQLAKDFEKLRSILDNSLIYDESLLVGPDITKPKLYQQNPTGFLKDFLSALKPGLINAITWHQGQDAPLVSFLNPDVFDLLEFEILAIKNVMKSTHYEDTPVWLGETSCSYGGGSTTYSDKFAATFIWLDKLGLAAKNGISLVVRQSLFNGHYALVDENYDPNPAWWISALYKKLVGPEVLDCVSIANSRVRLYCHCAKRNNDFVNTPAIVVFGFNVNYAHAFVRLEEVNSDIQNVFKILEFSIQTRISIVSKEVYLNNLPLVMQNGRLPRLKPKNFTSNIITIPPYSLGFWIIQSPKLSVC